MQSIFRNEISSILLVMMILIPSASSFEINCGTTSQCQSKIGKRFECDLEQNLCVRSALLKNSDFPQFFGLCLFTILNAVSFLLGVEVPFILFPISVIMLGFRHQHAVALVCVVNLIVAVINFLIGLNMMFKRKSDIENSGIDNQTVDLKSYFKINFRLLSFLIPLLFLGMVLGSVSLKHFPQMLVHLILIIVLTYLLGVNFIKFSKLRNEYARIQIMKMKRKVFKEDEVLEKNRKHKEVTCRNHGNRQAIVLNRKFETDSENSINMRTEHPEINLDIVIGENSEIVFKTVQNNDTNVIDGDCEKRNQDSAKKDNEESDNVELQSDFAKSHIYNKEMQRSFETNMNISNFESELIVEETSPKHVSVRPLLILFFVSIALLILLQMLHRFYVSNVNLKESALISKHHFMMAFFCLLLVLLSYISFMKWPIDAKALSTSNNTDLMNFAGSSNLRTIGIEAVHPENSEKLCVLKTVTLVIGTILSGYFSTSGVSSGLLISSFLISMNFCPLQIRSSMSFLLVILMAHQCLNVSPLPKLQIWNIFVVSVFSGLGCVIANVLLYYNRLKNDDISNKRSYVVLSSLFLTMIMILLFGVSSYSRLF